MKKSDFRRRAKGRLRGPVYAAALLASSALTNVAFAQVAEEDEIIVTATKRAENIQDIPLSVQALGSGFLDEQQVQSFDDYAALLPSVSFQSFGPGQAQVAFRGVSSGGDGLHIGPRPTAATYLDDVPVTTVANTVDLRIYDVARVEALSGPQGTLFGASALSGVVRVITNQPDPSGFEAGYDVEANYFTEGEAGGSLEGFLNIPLSNNAALRLVGYYDRDGGYIDNVPGSRTYTLGDTDPGTNVTIDNSALVEDDFNDVETYGGRAALRIDLNENWTSTTSVIAQSQQTEGPFLFDPEVGDLEVRDFLPTQNQDDWWMASQTIQGRIGNFDLVYAGSYFDRRVENEADYSYYTVAYDSLAGYYYTYFPDGADFLDPTQSVVLGDDYTKESHELRINSPAENRFRFTLGLFYQTQENNIEADYIIDGISGIPTPPVTVPVVGFGDTVFRTRITRDDEDFAVFGEASFDLTDRLTLTAGGRSFNTENSIFGFSGFQFNAENPNCLPTTATDRPCDNVNKSFEEDGTTYRVSAAYDFDDDRMMYATVSTGYRPGGNNRRPGIVPYESDTLTNYEIGWKSQWMDRALRFNGALFFQQWEDLQFGLSPLGSLGVTNTYNAGTAEIMGLEMDGSWIVGNWTFRGSATFVDAELTSDFCNFDALGNSVCIPGDPPAAAAGTPLPVQPEFKGTLSARYEFTLGGHDAFAQGTLFHQDGTRSFLTDADFAAVGPTKGFTTFDFSTGIDFAGHAWELYVNNLFDERGILSRNTVCATSFCGVYARSYPTQPRLIGVRVSRRF